MSKRKPSDMFDSLATTSCPTDLHPSSLNLSWLGQIYFGWLVLNSARYLPVWGQAGTRGRGGAQIDLLVQKNRVRSGMSGWVNISLDV